MTLNIGQAQVVVDLGNNGQMVRNLSGGNPNNIQSMPPGMMQPNASDMRHYNNESGLGMQ